jgi:CRISPR/Cas system CSM-associated protein Csm5 (group 7 of RAMP superfamily)
MAFGFKFWHIPEHRVFHYEPRYYDERKERLEEMYKKYGKTMPGEEIDEMARKEGLIEDKGKRYIPGMYIRGSFRETYESKRLSKEKENSPMSFVKKLILALTMIAMAAAAYYLSKGFVYLLVQ